MGMAVVGIGERGRPMEIAGSRNGMLIRVCDERWTYMWRHIIARRVTTSRPETNL